MKKRLTPPDQSSAVQEEQTETTSNNIDGIKDMRERLSKTYTYL